MNDEVFDARKLDLKCRGNPPPQFSSPQDKGGKEKHNIQKIARKNGALGICTTISVHVSIQT